MNGDTLFHFLNPPPPSLSLWSPHCGLDPSHSDSDCSPFEKLNRGPFGRVKWGPQEKTCWAQHSFYNLNHKGGGWRADVMAAAVLPLPWQRRRARQHSPTNSSPPSSWIKGTSDIINVGVGGLAKLQTRHEAGQRGWGYQWAFIDCRDTQAQKVTESLKKTLSS